MPSICDHVGPMRGAAAECLHFFVSHDIYLHRFRIKVKKGFLLPVVKWTDDLQKVAGIDSMQKTEVIRLWLNLGDGYLQQ